jgi:hypothetical protein
MSTVARTCTYYEYNENFLHYSFVTNFLFDGIHFYGLLLQVGTPNLTRSSKPNLYIPSFLPLMHTSMMLHATPITSSIIMASVLAVRTMVFDGMRYVATFRLCRVVSRNGCVPAIPALGNGHHKVFIRAEFYSIRLV